MPTAAVTKTEFARQTGVSETAVRKWISSGIIGPDALEGQGRSARIRVEIAKRQVADRRSPGQAMSNGLDTRLGSSDSRNPDADLANDALNDALKTERLADLRYKNRRQAEEEMARRGLYVRADATAAAMTRVAAKMLTVFDAGLSDIVGQLAAKHGIDRRELLHEARSLWRAIRGKASEAARREAENHAPLLEDHVLDASEPAAGEA
jgi:hypothetical protein